MVSYFVGRRHRRTGPSHEETSSAGCGATPGRGPPPPAKDSVEAVAATEPLSAPRPRRLRRSSPKPGPHRGRRWGPTYRGLQHPVSSAHRHPGPRIGGDRHHPPPPTSPSPALPASPRRRRGDRSPRSRSNTRPAMGTRLVGEILVARGRANRGCSPPLRAPRRASPTRRRPESDASATKAVRRGRDEGREPHVKFPLPAHSRSRHSSRRLRFP